MFTGSNWSSAAGTYVLHMQALTGPRGSDATLSVDSPYAECTVPTTFKKILLKTYDTDGSLDRTSNISDVEAPGGVRWSI